MKQKNFLVFFMAIVSLLLLVVSVSAVPSTGNLVVDGGDIDVRVNGINTNSNNVSVVAGETITVKVGFTANVNDTDVTVKVEIDGYKTDVDTESEIFDVEAGQRYRKTLTLKVPYELKDKPSDDLTLTVEIDGAEYSSELSDDITLRVQRPSYNAEIMSISTSQSVDAGELFPIDIVLKNIGYNDLDDLYISASIPALSIQKTVYVGDLITLETVDDDDFLRVRIYLQTSYQAQAGIYALDIEARNSDLVISESVQLIVNNDFANNIVVVDHSRSFGTGQEAVYELVIVNPTNKLKVYRIVAEDSGSLSTSVSESVVAIQAGSSKIVRILAESNTRGEYTFDVTVFSGENVVGTVTLNANVSSGTGNSAVVALTMILAIIFLVLLAVLFVLVRKKPEKTDEFGESYY